MKRIISLLAVMGLMAALLAASAMPAFSKVKDTFDGEWVDDNNFSFTSTTVGGDGSQGGGGGGKSTADGTKNLSTGQYSESGYIKGGSGSKGGGSGGNCTFTNTGNSNEETGTYSIEGNGSRC